MSQNKKFLVYCLVVLLVQFKTISCNPVQNSDNNDTNDNDDDSNSVTENGIITVVTRPNTRIVDLNNLDESNLELLRNNNINLTALRVQQELLRKQKLSRIIQENSNPPAPITQTRSPNRDEDQHRREYEEGAIDNIKNIIETALIRNSSTVSTMPSNVVTHEMAFQAECDMPRHFNESAWFNSDAWNILFKIPHNARYTLQSAVLRIYKLPDSQLRSDDAKNCTDNVELIRISVNVYERRRKRGEKTYEIRKKLCSSLTVSRRYEGWVEMDIKMAVKNWERKQNLGLAVEVQDINDNNLRTLDYFHPIDCNQASKPLPWSSYGHHFSYSSREMDKLPKQPRIDVEWTMQSLIHTHMYRFNRFARHNSHYQHSNSKNNHHHNHHRVPIDDLLVNSAEAHSYEGLSEEILSSNGGSQTTHKKRHFKHKLEHSLRKASSTEKLSQDNSESKETA